MLKDSFIDKIKAGKPALGLWTQDSDSVELCAHLGLDWFMLDMMFTGLDFGKIQNIIRAAEAAGITPVVRAQSNPWLGYDHRIAVDVTRLQGLGAQYIMVSHSSNREIEECLAATQDWHHKAMWVHPYKQGDWAQQTKETRERTCIIPLAESAGAFEDFDKTLALNDIRMFFIGMSDGSRVITKSQTPDWNHPELWKYVDKAVKFGEKNGVVIGANTMYAYNMKEMRERVKRLYEAGIGFILIQGAAFLFQVAMTEFLQGVREDLKLT